MAQQFLNSSEVSASLKQMGRKRMPQRMRARRQGNAALARVTVHQTGNAARRDASTAAVEEYWGIRRNRTHAAILRRHQQGNLRAIAFQRFERLAANGH